MVKRDIQRRDDKKCTSISKITCLYCEGSYSTSIDNKHLVCCDMFSLGESMNIFLNVLNVLAGAQPDDVKPMMHVSGCWASDVVLTYHEGVVWFYTACYV